MNAIVAVDANWAIGYEGDLLFSLPTDMRRFRSLTMGGTMILGRKTLESFPGGKPLPKRRNIVISRNESLVVEGAEVVSTPDAALALAENTPDDQIWVIGGGSVYTVLLSRCKRVYLTKTENAAPAADTFFPNLDKLPGWEVESVGDPITENGVTYRFIDYVNTRL